MRKAFGLIGKPLAGVACAGLLLATQTCAAMAQHMVASRVVPVRVVPVLPVGSVGKFLPAAAPPFFSTLLPAPALSARHLTAPVLIVPVTSVRASPGSRVAAALASRQDAPGLIGVIGHQLAGAHGDAPEAASFLTPSEEVRASAGGSRDWGEASFSVLRGEKVSFGSPTIVPGGEGRRNRFLLSRPRGEWNASNRPDAPRPAVRATGSKSWVWGPALGIGISALGMATGIVTNIFVAAFIAIAAIFGVEWLASRKAAREKVEQGARKEAEKREFIRRLKADAGLPVSAHVAMREAPGPVQSERFGGLTSFLDSWPGGVLVAGAGLAAAVYAGVIAVEFLPDLAIYVALALPSLVLPALGRDWLAGRLAGTDSTLNRHDWSLQGLLARISPFMTLAVPAVAFAFSGILFGRAKGVADADLSSPRRPAVALVGPAVNAALALLGAAAAAGLAWVGAGDALVSLVSTFIVVNVMMLLLDLLPVYPLGGHHIVRHLIGHVLAAPRAAAWLDRHPRLQFAVLSGALFLGGGLLNEAVLGVFGVLYWPAALVSVH